MHLRNSVFLLAVASLAAPVASYGADGPPPVISITREAIKEGRGAAHEKVEMDWAKAVRKAKLSAHYLALQNLTGSSEVWFVTEYNSFEDVQKGIDEVEKAAAVKSDMESLDARDGELRAGARTMYAAYREDLSHKPALMPVSKMRYVMASLYRVRLGKTPDFEEGGRAMRSAHEHINSTESYLCYQVIAGAPDALFVIFTPMESMKQMDAYPAHEQEIAQAMGRENFAKLEKSEGDVFASMENIMLMVNPRMSYVSKETEDADPGFWRPKMEAPAKPSRPDAKQKPGM